MLSRLPKTKVCGITRIEDLDALHSSGVEAVGLNLVPKSKRYLQLEDSIRLANYAVQLGLKTVAVVMDPTTSELSRIAEAFSWDFIQLHGQESPDFRNYSRGIAIIKATSWSGRLAEEVAVREWVATFAASPATNPKQPKDGQSQLAGFLLDAYVPGEGGGSGRMARWDLVYPRPQVFEGWPIMLAGGLTPDNVGLAIRSTHCDGVDTASGVELAPGIKSAESVLAFAIAANAAFKGV